MTRPAGSLYHRFCTGLGTPSKPGAGYRRLPSRGEARKEGSHDQALDVVGLSVWAFRSGVQGVKYNFNAYPVLGDTTLRK